MTKIKITKRDLKSPEALLKKAKAVDNEIKMAYPQHVYCNQADYNKLEQNLIDDYKKEYRGYTDRAIKMGVGHYLLNLGPNCSLSSQIPSGYILVDEVELHKEMKRNNPTFKKSKLGKVLYK